jgi:hypothetical protein
MTGAASIDSDKRLRNDGISRVGRVGRQGSVAVKTDKETQKRSGSQQGTEQKTNSKCSLIVFVWEVAEGERHSDGEHGVERLYQFISIVGLIGICRVLAGVCLQGSDGS